MLIDGANRGSSSSEQKNRPPLDESARTVSITARRSQRIPAPPRDRWIVSTDSVRQQQEYQLELGRQRELQRQQEEAERLQKAADVDASGMGAARRGNWNEAANYFRQALSFAPESKEISEHLARTLLSGRLLC